MENKIGAGEGPEQLTGYRDYLLSCHAAAASRTLVYATLHKQRAFLTDSPEVAFRQTHWFEIADWIRSWTQPTSIEGDRRYNVLVAELLLLMEDWGMAMEIDAGQLAAATIYRRSVEAQLLQILDQAWAACELEGTPDNKWSYDRRHLGYTSPWVDGHRNVYVEFGFDFDRDDADWSVRQLLLPSAYFAVRGSERPGLETLDGWKPAPTSWDGEDYLLVKHLEHLKAHGGSLHGEYVTFFLTAREELWQAIDLSS